MVDIAYDVSELTIPANTEVTISLPNQGATVHNFRIDELDVFSGEVEPGGQGSVVINAVPGTYTFYCDIPGHRAAGMSGTLIVQ